MLPPGSWTVRPWKWMVGRWVSFWDSLFSGAMLNFGGVDLRIFFAAFSNVAIFWSRLQSILFIPWDHPKHWIVGFHGANIQTILFTLVAPYPALRVLIWLQGGGDCATKDSCDQRTDDAKSFKGRLPSSKITRLNPGKLTYQWNISICRWISD